MTNLDILFGLVTVASLLFSIWLYIKSSYEKKIEKEKIHGLNSQINNMATITGGISHQLGVIINLTKRENITLDEIRHLLVLINIDIYNLHCIMINEKSKFSKWSFGKPSLYLELKETNINEINKKFEFTEKEAEEAKNKS